MNIILKLEGLGLFFLSTYGYFYFGYELKWFLVLFFLPDISFLGYLVSNKLGGRLYNILHHQGVFSLTLILGLYLNLNSLILTSIIFISHSNFDRMLGYGLKYMDSFNNTHLGRIGKIK